MLQKLSEQIRACDERAAEARDKAETTADPALRAEFLDMESRWLFLARSYQFTEGLADFTAANRQWQSIFERKRHDASEDRVREVLQRQLFDQLPVAVYVCEASGLIVYFNDQAAKLWGRSPNLNDCYDRFCGSYRMYSLDGEPIPHAECPMAEVLRTGMSVTDREIVIERADGSRGVALVNINPLKDATGKVIGAINCFHDITEQKRGMALTSKSTLNSARAAAERQRVAEALTRHKGCVGRAAKSLGVSRVTLWTKMKRFRLSPQSFRR